MMRMVLNGAEDKSDDMPYLFFSGASQASKSVNLVPTFQGVVEAPKHFVWASKHFSALGTEFFCGNALGLVRITHKTLNINMTFVCKKKVV